LAGHGVATPIYMASDRATIQSRKPARQSTLGPIQSGLSASIAPTLS
jgi:hypothetical protein